VFIAIYLIIFEPTHVPPRMHLLL